MQDTSIKSQPHRNGFHGEAAPAAAPSLMAPIIERVGVPLLWMGLGYLLCKVTQKGRAAA